MLKAGITYNVKKNIDLSLPDAEAEFDDEETIRAIQKELEKAGCDVRLYEAADDLPLRLSENRPDIVFNIAESRGGRGREAQVPAILNFLRIPFTGSDETALCIAMDKALAKRFAASLGVNTPEYTLVKKNSQAFSSGYNRTEAPFLYHVPFPVIVKPNAEGSSKGISSLSVAEDPAALTGILREKISAYKQDMLVERYIPGREFTVGILGNEGKLTVFPPMEIIFKEKTPGGPGEHSLYSYDVKRNFSQYVRYECPANIHAGHREEIMRMAETVYLALGCRDCGRVDFRVSDEGQPYFIEINPLPGLAPGYSDLPILASLCGMDYSSLIANILDNALSRYGLKR